MISSRYEIADKIHESARSIVYRGHRRSDDARVIIKAMQNEHPAPDELARFRREFELVRLLRGEGVVRPYSYERLSDRMAIVMADSGARALGMVLGARRLPMREVLALAIQIAGVLAEVHRQDVIHKDINPSNIVVNPATGRIQLIDFGLSTVLPRESPLARSPDVLEGTLLYVSPEQTGRVHRAVDYRTDLYSLGVTLYEMLTGAVPFRSTDPLELIHAHIAVEPTPPHEVANEVPRALSEIVIKLLSKSPDERYQSARGLLADLADCEARFLATGRIDGPGPVRCHVSDRFEIPQKLYGRAAEGELLTSTFDRVSIGQAEILLIAGYSGVGKSALVGELQRPVVRKQGYFAAGKFDQFHRDTPYASIIEALRELSRQLLTESEARFEAWRSRMLEALGQNGQVIIEVIPEVERIIGPQPPVAPLPPAESQNRFNFVFQRFVSALAAAEHPLALFLDDLQWADIPSLKLLQSLMTDPELRYLLVIGAYRDNEVTGAHPLMLTIEAIRKASGRLTTLTVAPLAPADVHRLIADTLRCDDDRVPKLSALAFEKTGGNPFFLGQFLRSLHEERLLERDFAGDFHWDLDAIRSRGITDNVVELMADKIKTLVDDAQQALKLAACIGNRFDLNTLSIISERSPAEAAAGLWEPLRQGLVVPLGAAARLVDPSSSTWLFGEDAPELSFKFLHDRVQQAAYSLIAESSRQEVHLRIGRLLLQSTPPDRLDERIFDVVNHIDLGLARIIDPAERIEAARLNLIAGRKAKLSAAHEPALRYLHAALSLLPEGAFRDHYDLTFALHVETIEAEYLNTRFAEAEALSVVALEGARPGLDQARVHEARMLFYTARMQFAEAIDAARTALVLLGVDLPASPGMEDILAGLGATQAALGGRRAADLLDLPESTDPVHLAAMRILIGVTASAYIGAPALFPLVVFAMINLCVLHGNSAYSAYSYSLYGLIHSALLGDAEGANAFGDLAIGLLDRFQVKVLRPKVYALVCLFVRHWKVHLRETYDLALEAIRSGMEMGDQEYAGYAAVHCGNVLTSSGDPLDSAAEEIGRYADMAKRFRLAHQATCLDIYHQLADTLRGKTQDPTRLVGAIVDEEVLRPTLIEAKNVTALCILEVTRCLLAYHFGDRVAAVAAAARAEATLEGVRGAWNLVIHNFYQSLSLLGVSGGTDEDRAQRLEKVEKNQAQLEKWAMTAPMNCAHKHDLVEAERFRVIGRHAEAMERYELAIQGAATHRYVHEAALASELCGEFHLGRGSTRLAEFHLREARHGYTSWGAEAKVVALAARHPELAWQRPTTSVRRGMSVGISTSEHGEAIDLMTVVKAAQAISGQIVLEQLIGRLMKIVLENAGAQRCVLLLERSGRLVVEAEQVAGQQPALCRLGVLAEAEPHLAQAIILYVERTRESVALRDAAAEGAFTQDPYIVESRARSILCAPLLNQGKRIALLYLENNLTIGAFTENRVEVLRLLSAQAVLSIQNAILFESLEDYSRTLEQKVEERTGELREKNAALADTLEQLRATQQQLVTQEKLASLGALTAGIAHELKNPLNFVTNFAELAGGLVDEVLESLDAGGALSRDVLSDVHESMDMLRSNVVKIGEHGRRANDIINGMLLHSRHVASPREPIEINTVIAQSLDYAVQGLRARDPSFGVRVHAEYDRTIGQIDAVAMDLHRVVINLINNAAYAIAQKRRGAARDYVPAIAVRTVDLGPRMEIRIRDNGTGISRDIVGSIWNPFFTTKPAGDGTGLGLSISYDIVTQGHQGEIRVESTPGESTEFIITLPKPPRSAA